MNLIGDPSISGWMITIGYLLVAFCCFLVRQIEPLQEKHKPAPSSYRLFWRTLAIVLLILGINKQLDLQSLITIIGKPLAASMGWYENRKVIQMIFVSMLGLLGIGIGSYLIYRCKNACPTIKIALAGFTLLLGFVVMRAASFHNFDQLLGYELGGIRFNWLMEIGALVIIGVATLRYRRNYL